MNIKTYAWVFPFLSFFAGYLVLSRFSEVEQLTAPTLIGQQLQSAIPALSALNLNLKVITQKEDSDLPEGTILSQSPMAGQHIKEHQSLYIVLSKKPEKIAAPALLDKQTTVIQEELKALAIRNKSYHLPSNHPTGTCIAQLPSAGKQLDDNKVITYISAGSAKPVLMPNFKQKKIQEVTAYLQNHNVKLEVVHTKKQSRDHICDENCIVSNQRPLAGSLVNLQHEKKLLIQLQVL